ncbi:MAG: CDP-diacylglycerol--serine O-phosphatidyltransferase [Pirellulales bacterium]|nr:CDP-diacylglycerol--serine O-phosphatidyltransferase [Pirellulales bacterium]
MSKRKKIRAIAVLPTMFTLGNLVCGFFAIVVASRIDKPNIENIMGEADPWNLMVSASLIFLAMIFDALDGHVARLSRTTSDFGGQLDSLCDLVTFGVAPAFLLVKMCPNFALEHRWEVWVIAAAFVACVALRLARYNVETEEEDPHMDFSGLPSPAGGAAIASYAFMFYALRVFPDRLRYAGTINSVAETALPFFALFVALLMVSRIRYPHVANQLFRGQRSFAHVVGLVFALVVVVFIRHYAAPILFTLFVFTGPARLAWRELARRGEPRTEEDAIFE